MFNYRVRVSKKYDLRLYLDLDVRWRLGSKNTHIGVDVAHWCLVDEDLRDGMGQMCCQSNVSALKHAHHTTVTH